MTWWSHNNPAFVAANKQMIERFEEANPDINIVYQHFPYDVFINKLQTGYASQTEPDIQQMFGTWVTEYASKGLLAELTTPKAELDQNFFEAAMGAYVWEGKAYGIPHEYNLENGGLFINTQMLEDAGLSAPKTWDELVQTAKQLAVWDGDTLQRSGFAFTGNDSITFLFLSFILQQGETYWAEDGKHVNFNTDAARRAWLAETGLEVTEKVHQERAFTADTFDLFFQGKAAMAHQGPWVIGVANESYKDMKYPDNYDYVPFPTFEAGQPLRFAAESGWGEVISARSPNKEAAVKFLEFMAEPDNAREWNITTFTVPALKSLADDAKMLEAAPQLMTSFAALPNGEWVGPVQNRDRFWEIIHNHYTAVALGQEKAEDSPALMTDEINAMIDEYLGP